MSDAKRIRYVVVRFYAGELPHIMGWAWSLRDARTLVKLRYQDDSDVLIWRLSEVAR